MSARRRGKRVGDKAALPTTSGNEKDAPLPEPEAHVVETESAAAGGDTGSAETAAGGDTGSAEPAVGGDTGSAETAVGGDTGSAETAVVASDPASVEATLRESDQSLKILLDICERRLSEAQSVVELQRQQLGDADRRWQSVLENSPVAVIEWSAVDYRIKQWSSAATQVLGWTAEETIGKRIDELNWIHPADRPLVDGAVADLLSGQCPRNVHRNRNVRKDGSVVYCEWYNSTLPDPSGGFSVLSLVLDVTERNRAEAALHAADLQLTEADQRKNEFLAALAHEVRHPLAPIKNSLYTLGQSGNEQARRVQPVIERQVAQLERLASDLLDVTRIARNKIKLQCQRLELNELVRHTMQEHSSLFEKAELHLELHPAPRPVFVYADWNRLNQVMANLLQNAAKYTGRGGATLVTVHAEKAEKQALVQVVDTGVGMTAELIARLFQPYSEADSALDRSKGGLGLGLALVKGLVELHGGRVTVYSAGPGHGTEFAIQLPLLTEEVVAPPADSEGSVKVRRRVLVIADDVDAADRLRDAFAVGEHQVEVSHNGSEGIAKAREFNPEVVLCDLGLSGMDGFEVARAFKADEALKHILLVALSDETLPEDLERVAQAGFTHHLVKPASPEKLQEILAALPAPAVPQKEDEAGP
jgi:two-component system CheB/CheR fusion protein